MNNVVNRAADEFQKSHQSFKSSGGESKSTLSSTGKKQTTPDDVINIMQRTSLSMKKGGGNFGNLPVVGKPIKPLAHRIIAAAP